MEILAPLSFSSHSRKNYILVLHYATITIIVSLYIDSKLNFFLFAMKVKRAAYMDYRDNKIRRSMLLPRKIEGLFLLYSYSSNSTVDINFHFIF